MPDHYTYPGTDVLINKFGITREDAWRAAETAAVYVRMTELVHSPLPGRFDLAHLQAIHRYLTQDM